MDSERVGRREPRVVLPRCDSPGGSVSASSTGGGKRPESFVSRQEWDSDDIDSDVGSMDRKRRRGEGSFSSNDGDPDRKSPLWSKVAVRRQAREEKRLNAERQLEQLTCDAGRSRSSLGIMPDVGDARTAAALQKRVIDDVGIILQVATTSMNLKGTTVRALREAAASIRTAVDVLHSRTVTEETAKLQADNSRLQRLLAGLRQEMADLRTEFRKEMALARREVSSPTPASRRMESAEPFASHEVVEQLTRSIMLQVGGMVNARLEGLEERLLPEKRLRPPLAADRRNAAAAAAVAAPLRKPEAAVESSPRTELTVPGPATAPEKAAPKKGKPKKTIASAAAPAPAKVAPRPLPPAPVSMDAGWTAVVKRGAKKARKLEAAPAQVKAVAAKPSAQQAPVKLRPPRSAAVVLTLQPGAEGKGVSYAKVLQEARSKINLASCGITAGLRLKKAITGGRILEIPGATSGSRADSLAQKLREVVDPELVRVSRPEKCADVRISGLEDSVSSQEVAAAIAQRGGCPAESVKAGELRPDSRGTCSVWVRCPVAAANKLVEGGRLLVGWVAAQVKLLQPRSLQCFRCLHKGHVRAACTAEVDRSDECYRCGQPGHRAAGCSAAAPRCSLCAAAKKSADHRVGSGACSASPPRQARAGKAPGPSHPPTQGGEMAMDASPC